MRRITSLGLLLWLAIGCDGVGRPLVGPIDGPDGGGGRRCETGPSCRPLRTLDPSLFDVARRAAELPGLDCDGDLVDDAVDNCLGVANPTQSATECEQAARDCRRLSEGELDLAGADLRGCRPDAPVSVRGAMSLRRASLRCADLAFVATVDATIDLSEASVISSRVHVIGEAPLAIDLGRTRVFRSSVTLRGAARLHAREAIFEESTVFIHPSGGAVDGAPAPAFDVSASNIARTTFFESSASRPGRIRIDRSAITNSGFDVRDLDLYGTTVTASQIASEELDAFEVDLRISDVRTSRGAFASSVLAEVTFDACESLRISDSEVTGVDVPACPPLGLRVFRSELDGCNLAGGVEFEETRFIAGVLGGGPATTLTTHGSELNGVRFCDLGAAAFFGGELRCVHCEADDFMDGESVCVSGTSLFERGCHPVEFALSCE